MRPKTLFMETTVIDPARSAGEITAELVAAGATSINTDYKDNKVCGLRWIMKANGVDVLFDMPVRVTPVFKVLNGRRASQWDRTQKAASDLLQAERVAWRQLLRWVQAQNAMIDAGMVQPAEVYLPYMVVHASGRTLFQQMSESQFKMLGAPAGCE